MPVYLYIRYDMVQPLENTEEGGAVAAAPAAAAAAQPMTIFDTMDALSVILLWIVFGYLNVLLNCDLQRMLMNRPLFLHGMAIIAFFFLMTTIDPKNKNDEFWKVAVKTVFVYALFVLVTKSKWYFALPVLVVLFVDQALKRREAIAEDTDGLTTDKRYRMGVGALITVLVVLGTVDYARLQKLEYKGKFSWFVFFFGLAKRCKADRPNYREFRMP